LQGVRLAINGRFRRGPQTGVQRVAAEIVARLSLRNVEIGPANFSTGMKGHAWEQLVLPARLAGSPLWSPCNTGPIAVRHQVVTIHDAAIFDHPEWFSRQFVAAYRFILPRLARRVRRIVTVSDFSRSRLAAALNIPAAQITVVPNGVSEQFAPVSNERAASVAARYGVRQGRYFASLSTIEPRKNLTLTIDAWAAAKPYLPDDVQLLLIGGEGRAQIFGRHDPAGGDGQERIIRSGFVPDSDLPALLGGAMALLYPSRYEGFGLPILEAMASGAPVVTANTSSLAEVGGSAALYVEPDDVTGLSSEIRRLASEPALRTDMREAGLARARLFSWSEAAAQMQDILRQDLGI